jgi:hypothetical protein
VVKFVFDDRFVVRPSGEPDDFPPGTSNTRHHKSLAAVLDKAVNDAREFMRRGGIEMPGGRDGPAKLARGANASSSAAGQRQVKKVVLKSFVHSSHH